MARGNNQSLSSARSEINYPNIQKIEGLNYTDIQKFKPNPYNTAGRDAEVVIDRITDGYMFENKVYNADGKLLGKLDGDGKFSSLKSELEKVNPNAYKAIKDMESDFNKFGNYKKEKERNIGTIKNDALKLKESASRVLTAMGYEVNISTKRTSSDSTDEIKDLISKVIKKEGHYSYGEEALQNVFFGMVKYHSAVADEIYNKAEKIRTTRPPPYTDPEGNGDYFTERFKSLAVEKEYKENYRMMNKYNELRKSLNREYT